jgi:tetratricopeptide (TPR) repeat protein
MAMQPGMMQPGMMQPGMAHPGMMQHSVPPGMAHPGMMQPSIPPGVQRYPTAPPQPAGPPQFLSQPPTQAASLLHPLDTDARIRIAAKKSPAVTLAIIGIGIAVFGVFALMFGLHAKQVRKIDILLKAANDELKRDTADSLAKSLEKLDEILRLDDEHDFALSMRAYALALRVYDHGIKEDRDKMLEAVKKAQAAKPTPWRYAAETILALYNNDPKNALVLGEKSVKEFNSVETTVAYAQAAFANGDLKTAGSALKNARDVGPTVPRSHAWSGEYFRRMFQISQARKEYDEAIKLEPNHALALAGRAILALEDPSRSAVSIVSAYTDWEGLRDIGRANVGPRNWARAKAVDAYLKALTGKNDEAEKALEEVKSENDADVGTMAARTYLVMRKKDNALVALQDANKLDPYRISSQVLLAQVLTDMGKTGEAEDALARARRLDPDNVQIAVTEALNKRRNGKLDESIDLLLKAEKEHPANMTVQLELLDSYRIKKDDAKVRERATKLGKDYGDVKSMSTQILAIFGQHLIENMNDYGQAVTVLKGSLEADAKNADAHYWLGVALSKNRANSAEAAQHLQKYLELYGNGPFADDARKLLGTLR